MAVAYAAAASPSAFPLLIVVVVIYACALDSTAAVVLEVFQDQPCLRRRNIRAYLHVEIDRFPVRRRPLSRVPLGMAPVAIHGVKFSPRERCGSGGWSCGRRIRLC